MNSGLVGALGTAPLQTVKSRLGNFRGRLHTQILLPKDGSVFFEATPSTTTGSRSFSGPSGVASGLLSVAFVGTASGERSFAGPNAVASGLNAVAFGGQAGSHSGQATTTNALAWAGTASGSDSCCLGRTAVASGTRSFVFGYGSGAGAADSYAFGLNGSMDRANALAFGSGRFAANGDSQSVLAHRRIVTTSTTVGSMTFSVPSGKVISFFANIIAVKSDGSAVSQYVRKFCIKNVAGTTSMVGTVETIGTDYENNPATDVAITADDVTDSLKIDVTGVISETWRWLVALDGAEIAYGT